MIKCLPFMLQSGVGSLHEAVASHLLVAEPTMVKPRLQSNTATDRYTVPSDMFTEPAVGLAMGPQSDEKKR